MIFIIESVLITALAAVHLRASQIDPHNFRLPISWGVPAIWAIGITFALMIAVGLALQGFDYIAALLGTFAIGCVFGPAINPPFRPRTDEDPSAAGRFLTARLASLSGSLFAKLVLGFPVIWATRIISESAWYWLTLGFALFLDVGKMLTAIVLSKDDRPDLVGPLLRIGLSGIAALLGWAFIAYPFLVTHIPRLNMRDYINIISYLLGMALTGVIL